MDAEEQCSTNTPGLPCVYHEDNRLRLGRIENDIREIKQALVGNELGHQGLIPRLIAIELQVSAHDKKLLAWGTILAAAGTCAVYLKDKILH